MINCHVCDKFVSSDFSLICYICNSHYHLQCVVDTCSSNEGDSGIGLLTTNWICNLCTSDIFPFSNVDDLDFVDCVNKCPVKINRNLLHMLQNITFNTIEDNEDNSFILSNDLDQFYTHASINDYCNSKYYTEDTFNDRCTLSFSESFSLIHLNIRSFQKKFT